MEACRLLGCDRTVGGDDDLPGDLAPDLSPLGVFGAFGTLDIRPVTVT